MWEEGQTWQCTHCGRECIIQRGVPQDSITHKRHTCEQYKKYIKSQPRSSLSDTFAAHSEDRSGKLVQVPYTHCGVFIRKKWRDEFQRYMTDEVYQSNKNMALFLAKYQRPMSEFFVPFDKQVYDYRHPVKRGVWGI